MLVDWPLCLAQGLQKMSLDVTPEMISALETYVALLVKWSKRMNLTAIRQPHEMITKHILDSLSVAPYLFQHGVMLDVGSGAGLPGIPLALLARDRFASRLSGQQDQIWHLIESNGKKVDFIQQACLQLNLNNIIKVSYARVENLNRQTLEITQAHKLGIISRAFAPVERMLPQVSHLLSKEDVLYVMQGQPLVDAEVSEWGYKSLESIALSVPGLAAKRNLWILNKQGA